MDDRPIAETTLTVQQIRLIEQSWFWFDKACEAFARGDRQAHRVAYLAHSMIRDAYRETLRG